VDIVDVTTEQTSSCSNYVLFDIGGSHPWLDAVADFPMKYVDQHLVYSASDGQHTGTAAVFNVPTSKLHVADPKTHTTAATVSIVASGTCAHSSPCQLDLLDHATILL
jgi:hypothetical protein